jgi:hypothetical protein
MSEMSPETPGEKQPPQPVLVAGMPLYGEIDLTNPLAAVVCIKGLDSDGDLAHWTMATEGLNLTDAIGMATSLCDDLRMSRQRALQQSRDPNQDGDDNG